MKLLLDTHIFIWSFLSPEKLTDTVAEALENSQNTIYVSPLTLWEILILAEKRRIQLSPTPEVWIEERLKELSPREAPLNFEAAMLSRKIDIENQDPVDRFLAATAAVLGMTLVTADELIIKGTGFSVLANA